MNQKLILSGLVLAFFCINGTWAQGIAWQKNTKGATFAQVKQLAKKQNKKIFLDFYTKWCGPCRAMDRDVFSKKEIGDHYNAQFINFKIDAEVGEGIELAKQYNVKGYPTYVFTDTEGKPLIDAGSSIGRSSVEAMIEFANEALGGKVKTWEEYQKQYVEGGKNDPVFLRQYMEARLKFTRMPPSRQLLWEWVQALPQETLFKNKEARNTIKWQARPGNEFYKLFIANRHEYPELKKKKEAIKFLYNIGIQAKWNPEADLEKIKKTLKADFPKYASTAFEYMEVDFIRFEEDKTQEYVDAYFAFIDKNELPIDMNPMLSGSLAETPNLKSEYAAKAIFMTDEGVNSNPPHFYSCSVRAYLLAKAGKTKEAKQFALQHKALTETFKGNKKMKWSYETMKAVEAGQMPKHRTRPTGPPPTKFRGPLDFPPLKFADIKGAPKLSKPFLVMGTTKPVMAEKHGLAAPALWDWDGDGKRDLLIGEFETTSEEHWGEKGSTVRVYKNIGEDNAPKFNDEFIYATDLKGRPLEVDQWCCIGFTPQFVDLDNDGLKDIITGQYHPGEVTWYRGVKGFRGGPQQFSPGIKLQQEGDPRSAINSFDPRAKDADEIETFDYWVYSSANFGDFDGDGDYDLITGGSSIRISENIGTKESPRFGRRKLLLDIHGKPLKTRILSEKSLAQMKEWGAEPSPSGSGKTQQVVVDWDNDGVLDILSTDEYLSAEYNAVTFFKGVKTKDGHRFQPGVALFEAADGSKAFPGSGQRIYVDDWNQDGVNDLIIGASIVTVDGRFHGKMSWEYEGALGIESAGKDYGRYPDQFAIPSFEDYLKGPASAWLKDKDEKQQKQMYDRQMAYIKKHLKNFEDKGIPEAPKMIHKGYVYVFLGRK